MIKSSLISLVLILAAFFHWGHEDFMNDLQIIHFADKAKIKANFSGIYIGVVDFSVDADKPRFFIVNTRSHKIEDRLITTHGTTSGPLKHAINFSNEPGSLKSSKGLMKTAEVFTGKHGRSLKLIGLEKGINDNVYERYIEIHPSKYTTAQYLKANKYPGRSQGCFAIDPKYSDTVIDKLKGGSPIIVITDSDVNE